MLLIFCKHYKGMYLKLSILSPIYIDEKFLTSSKLGLVKPIPGIAHFFRRYLNKTQQKHTPQNTDKHK